MSRTETKSKAFTLLELMVIVAMLGLLLSLMLPALAKTGLNSKSFRCLNNSRQLCNAWRMYADDSHDRIVYASDDGSGRANPLNQYAWTWSHIDYTGDRSNWDSSVDIMVRPLWSYPGRDAGIYRCPSDQSVVFVAGVARPRVRSVSMNLYLGGFAGTSGGWPQVAPFRIFLKTTELSVPGPSRTFVFMDQRPDSINWGDFFTDMTGYPATPTQYQFGDLPGMLHDSAAAFSFADGHTELHRWLDPRTTPPLGQLPGLNIIFSPGNPDIAWLQDHATRPK